MKTYKITAIVESEEIFIVKANSKEEALEELAEFNFDGEPEFVECSKNIRFEYIDKDLDIEVLGN